MATIRKAKIEDLKAIHDLEKESFPNGSYPLFVIRQLFDISHEYFLVAEVNQKIIGYVLGNHTKFNDQGWILSVGVHPENRRQNIAKQLIEKLITALLNSQSREICLTVHPENNSAIRLYKSLGFEVENEYKDYYLDSQPRLLMAKKTAMGLINS